MLDPDIRTLVGMGDIIGAIGLYQQRHGGSTLVARKAIEAARRELAEAAAADAPGEPAGPVYDCAAPTVVNDFELDAALRRGDKLAAVRRYRELYGVGLKEARDAVEAMQAGQTAEHPPRVPEEPELLLQPELDRLIAAGNKIEAIKHHRSVTNLGLKESKDAVEARMAELAAGATSSHAVPDGTAQMQPELDRLIRAEHKIMAIKHYRALTRVGLKEAKDAVEARMRELGVG